MHKVGSLLTKSALVVIFAAITPAVLGENLSRYREFQLGTDLATIAKQTGASASQAVVIHSRPALIQTLSWRPQPLGPSSKAESAQDVVFTFYDGALSGIVVNYDRYETEGLTPDDMVEALSATYGAAVNLPLRRSRSRAPSATRKSCWPDGRIRSTGSS